MGRQVKKLSGLEIDEVSLVDRPANQHGLVAIAKREDDDMSPQIFDAEGNGVDEEELEHGDVVYDNAGEEFVFIEDGAENDDEEVGKALISAKSPKLLRQAKLTERRAKVGMQQAYRSGKDRAAGAFMAHPKGAIGGALGASAAAGAGAGYAGGRKVGKSLGDQVLEDLSKAFTDSDRDEVIANAMDYMETISKRSDELEELVYAMADQRENEDFVELAKGYELPIDPEGIGGLMQRASQSMDQEDVATLDRLFSSIGEISKNGGFEQIGYDGYAESDVLSQVYAVAGEAISKADSSITQEQAVTALFSANPDAYDEYESEQRYNR